ncbi:hypothetical protein AA12717_0894 [Gluconacetobacter sacchari DSM 12717]|uniref:Conjugal transfer protein TrbC n=2 Tax=Gluconacetobacter sacchari TaxID=92759 RepID=A0A7W4IEU1_9PROT|nr:hypothetical protein [Gluconacetobacter sacchari]MBB2161596.1 hypothetical protein [Gluconacetobacter sacchari]GBQ21473.1 hypothetical protein AA12717_0894 [Gluconacetobacter sacchari DSM 12717]
MTILTKARLADRVTVAGATLTVATMMLASTAHADDFESWSHNGATKVGNGFEYWLGVACLVFAACALFWAIITVRALLKGDNPRHGWGAVIGSFLAGAMAFGFSYHAGVITSTFSPNGIETRTPGSQMGFEG